MSNSRPPWTRVPNLTKFTQFDLGIAIVSTRKGGVVDRSAFSELFPDALTSERTTVSPLDCIQEGVCRTFSKRDLRSAPSLESVDDGGLSSRDVDGFDRIGSLRVTPCAREWRLNGVSMADMAGYPLLRHGGDQANDMTVCSPHSSACMLHLALRFRFQYYRFLEGEYQDCGARPFHVRPHGLARPRSDSWDAPSHNGAYMPHCITFCFLVLEGSMSEADLHQFQEDVLGR